MQPWHIALIVFVNAVWGFNFVAAKFGVTHFPPIFFSGLRFVMVFAVALPFMRLARGQMKLVAGAALTIGVLHYSLMFTGMHLADEVSPLTVVVQLYVPFTTLIAVVWLGEKVGVWRIGGLVLAFGGVLVLAYDPAVFSFLDAVLLVVMAALAMAVGTVFIKSLRGVGVIGLQAWIALVAAPGLFAISYVVEGGQWAALQSAGVAEWSSVAYSAIAATLIGHGIVYYLLRIYPVSVTTPYTLLTPLFGIVFLVWLLDDHLTWRMVLGGVLTLGGVAIISLRESRKRAQEKLNPTV